MLTFPFSPWQSGFPQKNWLKGSVRDQNGKHEGCLALVKFGGQYRQLILVLVTVNNRHLVKLLL